MALLRRTRLALLATLTTPLLAVTAAAQPASATNAVTRYVAASGSVGDGSSCSQPNFVGDTDEAIQDAIDVSLDGDTVHICEGTFLIGTTLTITATQSRSNISIVGDGPSKSILDGQGTQRIIEIGSAAGPLVATISDLKFQNGFVSGVNVKGGAILVDQDAALTIEDATFVNNKSADDHGGAIAMIEDLTRGASTGWLHVSNSSFYKNLAGVDAGAISFVGVGENPSWIANSTFVENQAGRGGGAVNGDFSDVTIYNSTLINNSAPDGKAVWKVSVYRSLIANDSRFSGSLCGDGASATQSVADNASTDSSCLGGASGQTFESFELLFLAPWGGSTPTVAIGAGSSARNIVPAARCSDFDQRGEARLPGAETHCDAGAFEYQSTNTVLTPTPNSLAVVDGIQLADNSLDLSSLTSPIRFRFASEVNPPLPAGVSLDIETGSVSGTPSSNFLWDSFVLTAVDDNGTIANARITVSNCVLTGPGNSFEVTSRSRLELVMRDVCGRNANYVQTADIDWSAPWDGLGQSSTPFTGTYNGNGHSITGVEMVGTDVSFFRHTRGATITSLRLDVDVTGEYYASGLISTADATTIRNVQVSGIVRHTLDAPGCGGGLIGETWGRTIVEQSSFLGTIDAPTGNWMGGLIGCASDFVEIRESFADGTVIGNAAVGGLVGWIQDSNVSDSYFHGTVTAGGWHVGSLIGEQQHQEDPNDPSKRDTSTFTRTYASSEIQGTSNVGGLLGTGSDASINASNWEIGPSGTESLSTIGLLNNQSTAQPIDTAVDASTMKSLAHFVDIGWAIENGWVPRSSTQSPWGICDGTTRPFLLWQYTAATDPCAPPPNNDNSNNPPADNSGGGDSGTGGSESPSGNDSSSGAGASAGSSSSTGSSSVGSGTTATTVAPAAPAVAKANVGRTRNVKVTSARSLPSTGSRAVDFATLAACLGIVGAAGMAFSRRRRAVR